jgi:hypothetical protein
MRASVRGRPPVKGGVSEANGGLPFKTNPPLTAFASPLDRGAAKNNR